MITVAICDDNLKELEQTLEMCKVFQVTHPEYELRTSTFQSALDFNQYTLAQQPFDLILLDIYMPKMNGIKLATSLRARKDDCQIIFLTTSLTHAVEAFSLHAAHYLVKPFTQEQLEIAILRALEVRNKQKRSELVLKSLSGFHRISLEDIIYIETEGHYQEIHLEAGKSLRLRITSKELYEMLLSDLRFYKCGSTYILNLDKIKEITAKAIMFDNRIQLPMLRRQYRELTERFTRYALGGSFE